MNSNIVEEIKIELENLSQIPVIKALNVKLFKGDYLEREYQKIASAREKEYPTYRSEYRVAKTLARQRNQIIYQLQKSNPEVQPEFITVKIAVEIHRISIFRGTKYI